MELLIIAFIAGNALGRWLFYCDCGAWQDGYQCLECGFMGPAPYVYALKPCKKCGNSNYRHLVLKAHLFGGFTQKKD